jgi:hypothetical protein
LCFAETGIFEYTDPETATKVTLNTDPKGFDDAVSECRKQGGHLVAWDTYDDQFNAENYYVNMVSAKSTTHVAASAGFIAALRAWSAVPSKAMGAMPG